MSHIPNFNRYVEELRALAYPRHTAQPQPPGFCPGADGHWFTLHEGGLGKSRRLDCYFGNQKDVRAAKRKTVRCAVCNRRLLLAPVGDAWHGVEGYVLPPHKPRTHRSKGTRRQSPRSP